MNVISALRTILLRDHLSVQCPRCRSVAGEISRSNRNWVSSLICPVCLFQLRQSNGVYQALTAEREAHFFDFIQNYEAVRSAEGRGSRNREFYLALPDKDLTGKNEGQWKIRRQTYRALEQQVIAPVTEICRRKLDVVDLGAGNCWLSYRLALAGHRPVAIDLIDNEFDGLGAARHYQVRVPDLFPRFRAELNALPIDDAQFDVAIFNASFHYSDDYERTMAEALRCLRRPGWLVIADTAWYSSDESGAAMVKERRASFLAKYGFASDALGSLEFLSDSRLRSMEQRFGFTWQVLEPRYGLRWRLRPVIAKLRRRREPSRFRIYIAEVKP